MRAVAHRLARSRISTSSLRVELGGIVAELSTTDQYWIAALSERFENYLTEASPHLLIHHEPDGTGPPVECLPSGFEVRLNAGARTEFIDGVLRTRLPELAVLCCGLSGAGKSTLAALLPERALCDDLALARKVGGGFEGVSLPYWIARPGRVRLAGIFLLEHAPEHWKQRLAPAAAARALRSHVFWPTHRPPALRGAFATLTDLVAAVPVWRLGFAQDPSVWQLIAGAA
jgi:hypothetical protein